MNQLTVSDLTIDVIRKNIKNLHLAVYPPDGRIRIATPLTVSEESVRLFVVSKISWIRKQQAKYASQARQSEREYVRRESHYLWGQRYLLQVIEQDAPPRIELRSKTFLDLYVRPNTSAVSRRAIITGWYRDQLKKSIPNLIEKWEPIMDVEVKKWGIRHMKTKWGTCDIDKNHILLNLELVKKPERCLEYIIVHEMTHLLERHHNAHFRFLLDTFMPDWQAVKNELNAFIL